MSLSMPGGVFECARCTYLVPLDDVGLPRHPNLPAEGKKVMCVSCALPTRRVSPKLRAAVSEVLEAIK
jgi:hypothetical protein